MNKNTRNMKHAILLFAITTSALAGDFRNSSWGDSRETVIANEGIADYSLRNSTSISGINVEIAGFDVNPVFTFTYGQLTSAYYRFGALNLKTLSITKVKDGDFMKMVRILVRKYGAGEQGTTPFTMEWVTERTKIRLYDWQDGTMSLYYHSVKLEHLVVKREAEVEAEKKAAEEAEIDKALDLL